MTWKTKMFAKPIKVLVQSGYDANINHYTAIGLRYLTVRSKPELIVHHHDTKDTFPLPFEVIYDDTFEVEVCLRKVQENTRKIHELTLNSNALKANCNPIKAKDFLKQVLENE
jgi:hypothetical protein